MIEYYKSNIKQAKEKNPRIRKIAMMTIVVVLLQVVLPTLTMINEDLFNLGVMASTDEQYNIGTAQELWDFAAEVNGGNTFSGITVNLTADIALDCDSDNQWIPIGKYIQNTTVECGFNGIFEGNGHSISGIYIDTEEEYQGLFGFNTGIIKNVKVTQSYISAPDSVGGIVGENYGDNEYEGIVYNCSFSGTISAGKIENGTAMGSNQIGGIVGYNYKGTIEKCYNSGSITTLAGGQATGGIVGINSHGTIYECYNMGALTGKSGGGIGGIAGDNWGDISKCYNIANITSSNVGGIAASTSYGGTIIECYNVGNLSTRSSGDYSYVGGISGFVSGLDNGVSLIKDCYNIGIVSGNNNIGGICGKIASSYANVQNCYNIGNISATETYGGIVGYNNGASVSYCYYLEKENLGAINGNDDETNSVISKKDTEMKSSDFVNVLNSIDNVWKSLNNEKYLYPVLTWQSDIALENPSTIVNSIEVTTNPTKTAYIQNYETLDLTGGVLTVTYNDGSTDTISLTNENVRVTGFDNTIVGTNTLTVEYEGKTTTFDIQIISKQITEIEVTTNPTKTTYIQNYETLDLTNGVITVTYNDGSTNTVNLTNENVTVTGFDNTQIGTNILTVEYGGKTTTFDIQIISKQITEIEVTTNPTKTTYIQNYEILDLTNGILTVTYNDESTSTVNLTNENVTVTGFDNTQIGTNTLTVEYGGKTTTFDIQIISKQITEIEITTNPTKTTYIQNYETLDLTNGILTVTYNDGSTSTVNLTNENVTVTGFDNTTVGTNTLTVEYGGKTTTFDIQIISKQITGIEVTTNPTKTTYIQNYETLDLTNGVITVTYNDGSTSTVSLTNEKVTVTGFDNTQIGTNTLTVEYEGKTTTFDIEIVLKQVTSISVTTNPTKTTYIQNYETLDLTNGILTVTYNDGSTSTVSLTNEKIKVTGFNNSTVGTNTLTVEYEEKTTTFDIEIVSKQITGISVTTNPTKTTYIQNYETLDLTNGIITVTYNDESADTISLTNEKVKVTGFDNTKTGTNTLTIEYEGNTTTFDIEIISKQVSKIRVTTIPTKTIYIQNYEKLDLTDGIITVTYNDESTDTISLTNEKVKVTGFDNTKIGTNTITVEYEGKNTTFDIEIISKQATGIQVTTNPTKTTYIQNREKLDLTGGIVTITYNDGSTETISLTNENVKVTGFDNTKAGTITLTVEYAGNKTTFDIKIISENTNGSDNKEEDNSDDTLAEGVLPNAGGKNIIFIVITLILIISVIFNKKYKKYKDI